MRPIHNHRRSKLLPESVDNINSNSCTSTDLIRSRVMPCSKFFSDSLSKAVTSLHPTELKSAITLCFSKASCYGTISVWSSWPAPQKFHDVLKPLYHSMINIARRARTSDKNKKLSKYYECADWYIFFTHSLLRLFLLIIREQIIMNSVCIIT